MLVSGNPGDDTLYDRLINPCLCGDLSGFPTLKMGVDDKVEAVIWQSQVFFGVLPQPQAS